MAIAISLSMVFYCVGCGEIDVDTVAMVIEQASAVAYNEVIHNNPELEPVLAEFATASLSIIDGEQLDVVQTKQLLRNALSGLSSLDEDDKRIIVDLFSIVIPLMRLPESGALSGDQRTLVRAFFQGICNAVDLNEDLRTDEEVENTLAKFFK
jgi:hypothetical protein